MWMHRMRAIRQPGRNAGVAVCNGKQPWVPLPKAHLLPHGIRERDCSLSPCGCHPVDSGDRNVLSSPLLQCKTRKH